MAAQETLYPLEFVLASTPLSLQASARSKERWKAAVRAAARERITATDELGFLDRRPLSLTIHYLPERAMQGDVDKIVKPIMDALIRVAFLGSRSLRIYMRMIRKLAGAMSDGRLPGAPIRIA